MLNKIMDMIVEIIPFDSSIENLFIDKIIDPDYDKNLLYCLCAYKNNYKILKLLLKYGVNKNYNTNEALYFCIKNNAKECVDLLIDESIDLDQVMNIERY